MASHSLVAMMYLMVVLILFSVMCELDIIYGINDQLHLVPGNTNYKMAEY